MFSKKGKRFCTSLSMGFISCESEARFEEMFVTWMVAVWYSWCMLLVFVVVAYFGVF